MEVDRKKKIQALQPRGVVLCAHRYDMTDNYFLLLLSFSLAQPVFRGEAPRHLCESRAVSASQAQPT